MTLSESSSLPVRRGVPMPFGGRGGDPTVVRLRPEDDLCTIAATGEILAQAMSQDDADHVDMSEVKFMNGATMGVIGRYRNHLRGRSWQLALRSLPPRARRVLDKCDHANLGGPDQAGPKLRVATHVGEGVTAETMLLAPDAELLAARHAMVVARRRGP
jgi:anti-anti-sigma regulatory factor